MSKTAEPAKITMSQIAEQTIKIISNNQKMWLYLGLIFGLPMLAHSLLFGDYRSLQLNDSLEVMEFAVGAIWYVIILIFQAILFSLFVKPTIDLAKGKKYKDINAALTAGKPVLWRVILATLVVIAIVSIGLVFLIIPGLIALVLLYNSISIVADTKKSLSEAMSLSIKYGKQFAGVIVVYGLCLFALSVVFSIFGSVVSSLPEQVSALFKIIADYIVQLVSLVSVAVLYVLIKKNYRPETTKAKE